MSATTSAVCFLSNVISGLRCVNVNISAPLSKIGGYGAGCERSLQGAYPTCAARGKSRRLHPGVAHARSAAPLLVGLQMCVGRAQPGHRNVCGVSARNQVANHMIG